MNGEAFCRCPGCGQCAAARVTGTVAQGIAAKIRALIEKAEKV